MHKSEGASTRLSLFVPISKFDEEKGIAYGYAAEEAPDRAGEIMDYAKAKPKFQSWSATQKAASGGKSLGNIRLMHSGEAVGKVNHLEFLDDEKRVFIGVEIVDAGAREKAAKGVLTGFSIGGSYAEKWKDADLVRYVPEIQEISLVDRPCMPGATFTIVKADGSEEIRKFAPREVKQVWSCGTAGHEHIAKSDAVLCEDVEVVADPVEPELVVEVVPAPKKAVDAEALRKSMYSVSDFAAVVFSLNCVRMSAKFEAEYENDDSPLPAALAVEVEHLSELLLQMTEEETAELVADVKAEKFSRASVRKLIAAIPEADRAKGAEFLTKAAEAFERAGTEDSEMKPEELQKVVGDSMDKAFESGIAKFTESMEKKLDEKIAPLTARLEAVEKATPEPSKIVARVVAKAADVVDEGTDPEKETPKDLMGLTKAALQKPVARY